jgi:cAMP-dependent protein kinase regulator
LVNFKKQLKTDQTAKPPLPMIGFGEIALLYNDKRTATVTATTDCEAWVLSGDVYKHIIAKHSIRRRNISLEYLDKVNLFKNLETYEKLKLIDGLKVVEFRPGEYVIHEGDKGDNFYIIEKGEVQAGLEKEDGNFTLVRNLEAGSHFGEIALINNVRRTMSIRSVGNSQLLCLTRGAFNRILGSIKKFLAGDYASEEVQEVEGVDGSFTSNNVTLQSRHD